jgi:hypothetical protein
MCDKCDQFNGVVTLHSAAHLKELIAALRDDGLSTGILRIVSGGLVWEDIIDCLLECTRCGQQFQLFSDTYHGNGKFQPIKTKVGG